MRKVIIDTDPGVDDAMAIAFAHLHPEIEILGVTTVFGNADIDRVTDNATFLKELLGLAAPVAKGAARPLARPSSPPPTHVHGANGLGDAALPARFAREIDARPAHRFIGDVVRAHAGEVTLICLGRLTNVAMALLHDPELPRFVRDVAIMGGAFGSSHGEGNVTPVAEANIIGDPHAAALVFAEAWPLAAVGLDVTRRVRLAPDDFRRLAEAGGPVGRFLAEASAAYVGYHRRFGVEGCYVHDPSAVAYAVAPELFTMREGPVLVATDGPAVGQTIQRRADAAYPPLEWDAHPHHRVAVDVDADGVRDLFLRTALSAGG